MSFIRKIPLFALLLLLYNAAAFGDYYQPKFGLDTLALKFPLNSGVEFSFNIGEMLLLTGIAILYLELLKSTRTTKPYLTEHLLSMAVFIIFLVEFFMVPQAGTIVFCLLMVMSLLDVVGGFSVTLARHVVIPGTLAAQIVAADEAVEEDDTFIDDEPEPAAEPMLEPEPARRREEKPG